VKIAAGVPMLLVLWLAAHGGQPAASLEDLARQEQGAFLDTLRELVSIDSGSRDLEGLERISEVIEARLRELGGEVELVEPGDGPRFEDTPERIGRMVLARFEGTGTARILLLAHMDTVYERGTAARQPFRLVDDRAYGAGIADDKHGVALILHTVAMLRALDFRGYGRLTVLINADEEISSPGSRSLIARLGREHDVVLSCESGGAEGDDRLQLATAGIGDILLTVSGRAAHAGVAPEEGRNAFYELAHQVLQLRDLSDPSSGRKVNWTVASAGTVRNAIPAVAHAVADVRVRRESDWDALEKPFADASRRSSCPARMSRSSSSGGGRHWRPPRPRDVWPGAHSRSTRSWASRCR
jgi:glutamate carboxypeptidase